eukprot:gene2445-3155_t
MNMNASLYLNQALNKSKKDLSVLFENYELVLEPFLKENTKLSFNISASMKAHGKLFELKSNKGLYEEIVQKCMCFIEKALENRISSKILSNENSSLFLKEYSEGAVLFQKLLQFTLKTFKEEPFKNEIRIRTQVLFQSKLFSKIKKKLIEELTENFKEKTSLTKEEEKILETIVLSEKKEFKNIDLPKFCLKYMEKYFEEEEKKNETKHDQFNQITNEETNRSTSNSYKSTNNPYKPKSSSRYVGLKNQGATCYLNSLIQSLFMTPPFRRSVFQWRYNLEKDKKESKCIPLQLQKLFARLKFSNSESITTNDLTKSFGWSTRESFEQNDVEELLRILFESLENTSIPINSMYEGLMRDYIECLTCNHIGGKIDKFLDLQLVIRNVHHLYEALDILTFEEVLKLENQYFCEKCNEKRDAKKGSIFEKLPDILTLHLKRFDIDYESYDFRHIKLNNQVIFPMTLNMNKYISKNEEKKENFYELTSVLIHSGSLSSGHYYAYIKNEKNEWFEFNDSNVSKIEFEDIEKAYGDENSKSNAYMLLYSRENNSLSNEIKNLNKIKNEFDLIPSSILNEIEKENDILLKNYYKFEQEREYYKFIIIFNEKEYQFKFENDDKLNIRYSVKKILNEFIERNIIEISSNKELDSKFRLRIFDKELNIPQDILNEEDSFKNLHLEYNSYLYLERKENNEFLSFNKNEDFTIQFYKINEEKNNFKRVYFKNFKKNEKLKNVKESIMKEEKNEFNFYKNLPFKNEVIKLSDENIIDKSLVDLNFLNGDKIYIEENKNETLNLLEYLNNKITIHFNEPNSNYFNKSLIIDKRLKIKDLKDRLSDIINLDSSKFKLFNGKDENGYEFKNYDSHLNQLINGSSIFIKKGRVLNQNEFNLTCFQFQKNEKPKPKQMNNQNYIIFNSRNNIGSIGSNGGNGDGGNGIGIGVTSADDNMIIEKDDILQDDDNIIEDDDFIVSTVSQSNPNKKIGLSQNGNSNNNGRRNRGQNTIINTVSHIPPAHFQSAVIPPNSNTNTNTNVNLIPPGGAGAPGAILPNSAVSMPIVAPAASNVAVIGPANTMVNPVFIPNHGGGGAISAADQEQQNPYQSTIQYNNDNFDENEIPLQLLGNKRHYYRNNHIEMNSSFIKLFDLIIDDKCSVKNLKKLICQNSNEFYPSLIRIREKIYKMDYPGKILLDDEIISKSIDMTLKNKEIVIEKIEKIEDLTKEDFTLRIGRFYPEREALSFIDEILINTKTTINDLMEILTKTFKISKSSIQFTKIPQILHSHLNDISTFKKLKWFEQKLIKSDDDLIIKSPFYFQNVDLLICQDENEINEDNSSKIEIIEERTKSKQLRFYDDDEKK